MSRTAIWIVTACMTLLLACAPMTLRTKAGGAARWAASVAERPAVLWAQDARLCRVVGVGIGMDGWLPDRGGTWILTYWSAGNADVLEVSVDGEGRTTTKKIADSPVRGYTLPADWSDSPTVWGATRSHQKGEGLNTFEAELGWNSDPERHADEIVWRIRFFMVDSSFETHVTTPQGKWLQSH